MTHNFSRKSALFVAVTLATLLMALVYAVSAGADGDPSLSVSIDAPANALYGTTVPVSITAANPQGGDYGYNLTFQAVLPVGVTYAAGSSTATSGTVADPTIITNSSTGQQTLVWSNVSDISGGSSNAVDFKVNVNTTKYDVGGAAPGTSGTLNIEANAYVGANARTVPTFDSTGTVESGTWAGDGLQQTGTTKVTAIQIQKSGPATLLRGVHDHQGTYTLTVTNNSVNPTDSVTVDDYLPADLEFLGCGGANADNTTNAIGTNPGSTDEYPGSGAIVVPAVSSCVQPVTVETVQLAAGNSEGLAAGVYTHVVWTVGNLTPGQVVKLPYTAAVPIRENTLDWAAGTGAGAGTTTTQPATTGIQTANLDNNTGAETYNNEPIVNTATAQGNYQDPADSNASIPASDSDTLSGVAKDIIIAKTVDPTTLEQGQISTYTLTVSTSEYRFFDNVSVTDTLPNGQCPLDSTTGGNHNFENQQSGACDPVSSNAPSSEYLSADEQVGSGGSIADGDYAITWDDTTDPDLTQIPVNGTVKITFPVRTLQYYQKNGADDVDTPVLSNDSITNSAGTSGTSHVRCAGGSNPEDCASASAGTISHDTTTSNGTTEDTVGTDAATASQAAVGPTIEKEVAAGLPVDGKCTDATYETTNATYGPGDDVCWKLIVDFPKYTDTRVSDLYDFIPTNAGTYVTSSLASTSDNTVAYAADTDPSLPQPALTVCPVGSGSANCGPSSGDVEPGDQVLAVTFETTEGAPDEIGSTPLLSGLAVDNLMKFASENTAGTTFPLRAMVDFTYSAPTLSLNKTIVAVDSTTMNTKNANAVGGDTVEYQLSVANSGTTDAQSAEIWDELPSPETCADVVASANYTCVSGTGGAADHIVFSPVFVPAGGSVPLTFSVNIPNGATEPAPKQQLTDTAGVTSYQSTNNTGGTESYYPAGDLDPTLSALANAPAANSTATVTITAPTISKQAASTVAELNTAHATIGEPVNYAISSTLPASTTLYGNPTLVDDVPSTLNVNDSTVTAELNGAPLPAGFTLTASGNTLTVALPSDYVVGAANQTLTLAFTASVVDSPANTRGDTITNTAALDWSDGNGSAQSVSASANETVVEPDLAIDKTDNTGGTAVSPGQTVTYTVMASNPAGTNVSTAHNVVITDPLPAGVTFASAANSGSYNAGNRTITWNVGDLAPGASVPVQYTVTVDSADVAGEPITNVASGTADSLPANTSGERTSISGVNIGYSASSPDTIEVAGPTIAKTASPTSATIGQTVTYTATVTLPANTTFHDLTVLDTLPNGMTFGAYGSTSVTGSGVNTPTSISSKTHADGTTNIGWFVGEVAASSTTRTIAFTYTATVDNQYANNSLVVDNNSLINSATVETDQTQKITSTPTALPAASSFENQWGTTAGVPATAPVSVVEPHLTINKQVVDGTGTPNSHTATANEGDTLTYSVTVTNTGDAGAYMSQISDPLPSGLTNVSASPSGAASGTYDASTHTLQWTIGGEIDPGASVTLTYTATAPTPVADQTTLSNTATLVSYSGLPNDPASSRTYTPGSTSTDVVTVDAPTLAITKTPTSPTALAGSSDSYTVVVSNTGHATSTGVTVADVVPKGMTYTAASATATAAVPSGTTSTTADSAFAETSDSTAGDGSTDVAWALGSIPAGDSVTITVPVSFPANTVNNTQLTNTAKASSPNTVNSPSGSGTITVHTSADLVAIKSVATTPIPAGGQDTYTLTVHNIGPSDAQSVTLTDPLPSSETFVSADAGCTNSANTVTCDAGTVAAGASATFHVTVAVSPSVTGTISNTLTVASPTTDPNPANNTATIAPDSVAQSDLSVTKTADKIQYNGGDTITYTITASNSGPAPADGVVITDPLPSTVTYLSSSSGCTQTSGTVNCDITSLAAGSSQSFTVKAIANGTPPPAATPGTGDELVDVNKIEQQVTLTPGQTTTQDLSCNSGYISDGNAKVIEVDQGTGTLASVEILKSWAVNQDTYEFTLDNTATGNAQVQLFAVCLPATTTADQNGNTHALITDGQTTQTETLSQGDHTITVDVGNADVPISPSFQFLGGDGTVQGSEGSSNSSVWTYTVDVTTPTATVKVGSTGLQTQPSTGGSSFTNDLEFTSVSQQVTVGANSTTSVSVVCPNGYEGIEATYDLPDGLLLLGDDPEPITRVYLLDNTTGSSQSGTLDLLCLADRTGPEVDYLGPVLNTATGTMINVDPNPANNAGTAAIRIDRAVGSGSTVLGATVAGVTPAAAPAPAASNSASSASSAATSAVSSPSASTTPAVTRTLVVTAPAVQQTSLKLTATTASIVVACAKASSCQGTAKLLVWATRHGKRFTTTIATVSYKLSAGKKLRLVLHLKHGVRLTKAERKRLILSLTPKGAKASLITLK